MSASHPVQNTISARSARASARLFNYGNIISMLLPMPLGVFWFGASMAFYAMNRNHPNERVGYYTQQAAYRFYGITGFVVVAGTFYGNNWIYWLVTWLVCAGILIPWSVLDLVRIQREEWHDVTLEANA